MQIFGTILELELDLSIPKTHASKCVSTCLLPLKNMIAIKKITLNVKVLTICTQNGFVSYISMYYN